MDKDGKKERKATRIQTKHTHITWITFPSLRCTVSPIFIHHPFTYGRSNIIDTAIIGARGLCGAQGGSARLL